MKIVMKSIDRSIAVGNSTRRRNIGMVSEKI
jgi:hypothetical protein